MRPALVGVVLLLALVGASAAAPDEAQAATAVCYATYDGLIWHALGVRRFVLQPGAPRCQSPETAPHLQTTVFSNLQGGTACRASYDGLLWYRLPPGDFAPLFATQARCDVPGKLTRLPSAFVPAWAQAGRRTRAIFAVASLQHGYAPLGMQLLAAAAHADRLPVTWLVADPLWLLLGREAYERGHRAFGDDVQTVPDAALRASARSALPWMVPSVAVESTATGRDIERDRAAGYRAFWGIAWNSSGADGLADRGAPWGAYCADAHVYKRPAPKGDCSLVALEWTARDLTAAFWSEREDIYSTDPDDLLVRGGFDFATSSRYVRALIDAYAAAGAAQSMVVVAQQESDETAGAPLDAPVLRAMYDEARHDGMRALTLPAAAAAARTFAAAPRAVAFPVIAPNAPPSWTATIDFHDVRTAMTFAAGRTTPLRVFSYDELSALLPGLPVPEVPQADLPRLVDAAASGGTLTLAFAAPRAEHYGIAFWSDPAAMGWTSPNVYRAGHAGAVAVFDLPAGLSYVTLHCRACTSTTFTYSR